MNVKKIQNLPKFTKFYSLLYIVKNDNYRNFYKVNLQNCTLFLVNLLFLHFYCYFEKDSKFTKIYFLRFIVN